jgi:hypothetical protein
MPRHPKSDHPTDADLNGNPLIGGTKGTHMAGVSPDELDDLEGENTIEGDVENDVNRQGGVDKPVARAGKIASGRTRRENR